MGVKTSQYVPAVVILIIIFIHSGFSRNCHPNELLVPCSNRSINTTECSTLGCCWNSNTTTQCFNASTPANATTTIITSPAVTTRTTSTTQRNGYCVNYNKPACSTMLNQSHSRGNDTFRFIDSSYGINKTERLLSEFLRVIEKHVEEREENCIKLLKIILCQFLLPKCDVNDVPKNYCREDCDAIFHKCNSEMNQLLAVVKYMIQNWNIKFVHLVIPNCTQFKYSTDGETCEHFGLFDFQKGSTRARTSPPLLPIVGGAVGLVVLIAVVIIAAVVIRRRVLKSQCDYRGVTFTAVTMRDRLRADTMMALDEMKVMSLYNPDDLIQYPLDKVEYVKDLGEGNFGQVFQGRAFGLHPLDKPGTELMVAVKTLKSGCSTDMKVSFLKEVTMMSVLHHDNIVELLAVSTEEEPYGMIFEFMVNGDLNQYLRAYGPYVVNETEASKENIPTKEDLLSISLQVANGMEYLQNMRLVHRDLATRNCLVGHDRTVKIADFGMSRDVYASDYYKVEGQAVMPIRWMPPEALLFGKFTVESDVYSYGVLLWEIYTYALQPYYGYTNEEVVAFIKKGVHLGKPDDCEDYIYDIMKYCWNKDPSQRLNFQKIKGLLKQEEESPYDLPDEPTLPPTITNPLYADKLDFSKAAPAPSPNSSPALSLQKNDSSSAATGYMNIGYKGGKEIINKESVPVKMEVELEEGEQEI